MERHPRSKRQLDKRLPIREIKSEGPRPATRLGPFRIGLDHLPRKSKQADDVCQKKRLKNDLQSIGRRRDKDKTQYL